ncbi:MAG: hypothetical protein IJS32_09970 [Kiritimatiellae bacterium]|nr:hypothetical protein [Kiritimatiellia bacterium]
MSEATLTLFSWSCLGVQPFLIRVSQPFFAPSLVPLFASFSSFASFYEKACQEPFVRDELLLPSDALNLASIRTLGGRPVLVARCTVGSI